MEHCCPVPPAHSKLPFITGEARLVDFMPAGLGGGAIDDVCGPFTIGSFTGSFIPMPGNRIVTVV